MGGPRLRSTAAGSRTRHISSSGTPGWYSRKPSSSPSIVQLAVAVSRLPSASLTRFATPSPDMAPTREVDRTRTLAAPQDGVEPFTPIQAQNQGVVSLVEKHPSEPALCRSKCAGNRVAPDHGGTASHGRLGPKVPSDADIIHCAALLRSDIRTRRGQLPADALPRPGGQAAGRRLCSWCRITTGSPRA